MAKDTDNTRPGDPAADGQVMERLQAENAELRGLVVDLQQTVAGLEAQLKAVAGNRAPTKAELQAQREAREKAKADAMAKRDAQSRDLVTIQKFNRDGDVTRERVCAKADVEAFKRQGYKLKGAND